MKLKLIGTTLTISLILLLIYATLSFPSPSESIATLGWYCIDWGPSYWMRDFATIKSMHIDTVILRSFRYLYVENPEAFTPAINTARNEGLDVGISLFHPANQRMAKAWNLPETEDGVFIDFTINRTWIDTTYQQKLADAVDYVDLDYYMFDDMVFSAVSNLSNAQYFIDVTVEITNDKTVMLAYYPPKMPLPTLHIPHWDWYTAPEDLHHLRESRSNQPFNSTSLGHFIWLYERTDITFEDLSQAYNVLGDTERLQIFSLRYGDADWPSGVSNSILEHPSLIEALRRLNQQLKG